MDKGRNAQWRSRLAIAVSHPGPRLPKSPRIAAIPSARSPISRRLHLFGRCPRFLCLGRTTTALPPLPLQRPFPALTCTQHAGSLRHLPKPTARVLHRKAPAVWTCTAAQDSSGAGTKKELPIGTTLSNKNQGQSGVQKSESKFLLTGGACNIDNFTIASIVRAKKILKKLSRNEYVREKMFRGHVQRLLVSPYDREVTGGRGCPFMLR